MVRGWQHTGVGEGFGGWGYRGAAGALLAPGQRADVGVQEVEVDTDTQGRQPALAVQSSSSLAGLCSILPIHNQYNDAIDAWCEYNKYLP